MPEQKQKTFKPTVEQFKFIEWFIMERLKAIDSGKIKN